ncbi:AsnC family transcriptional regulator [Pokkaliibacter plantistimulans]|uniref:AsnC family transcriptional regulator n=2 Tax=Pseudomonadota TaxID=1224 RepID=A0ABX5LZ31_9GAMM|nr:MULTISPECIES: Lrp/AsnC family transcriptional regulator [Pokkaliibacter]MDH2436066.1 Lrp/AsnC family transcriptional regulator [Pokkaliibacter sp. MBI-7]PPC76482.1 AsnC family transcriptional regulator [Pokkaliibacter plantistimulans]PXF31884.1 AsnC family transcriptional regulator [Pokkaliibacter plantistimulans]
MSFLPFDQFDRLILAELQQDGRIKNQLLADRVGLSPAACWRRVKALEEQGVIRKYTALLDPQALDQGLCVLVTVTLLRHSADAGREFEEAIVQFPEVLQCYAVTGNSDYLLRIVVPDMATYDRFLNQKLFSMPGISQVHSNFALREVKNETSMPMQRAMSSVSG